jgi:hypothetical protein
MTISPFDKYQYHTIINESGVLQVGSFVTSQDEELKYIRPWFCINMAITTERFRILIYSDSNYDSVLYTSEWSNFSDIENLANNWSGFVTATFGREHLKSNTSYYVGLELDNYTRNAYTDFISVRFDYCNSTYPKVSTQVLDYPSKLEIYTYKEVEL